MPLIFMLIGGILILAAYRNTLGALGDLVAADLSAEQGGVKFATWFAAIVLVGGLGYVPVLRGASRWLIALTALVIVLETRGGIFTKLRDQLAHIPASQPAEPAVPKDLPAFPLDDGGSGGTGGTIGPIAKVAMVAA